MRCLLLTKFSMLHSSILTLPQKPPDYLSKYERGLATQQITCSKVSNLGHVRMVRAGLMEMMTLYGQPLLDVPRSDIREEVLGFMVVFNLKNFISSRKCDTSEVDIYYYIMILTKTTATQSEALLSYHRVRRAKFSRS